MMLRSSARPAVIASSLAVVLIVITSAFGSLGNTSMNTTCRQVAIQLDTKEATQEQLVSMLREQLNVCGISATEAEIQKAARGSLNLIGKPFFVAMTMSLNSSTFVSLLIVRSPTVFAPSTKVPPGSSWF